MDDLTVKDGNPIPHLITNVTNQMHVLAIYTRLWEGSSVTRH
jgi:hypothetical protein